MDVDDAIKAVITGVEGRLIDLGWSEEARDPALRAKLEAILRPALAAKASTAAASTAPPLDDVEVELNSIVSLLRKQQSTPPSELPLFSVFLGSGAYFGPPQYAPADIVDGYPANVRPPIGNALAQLLATDCEFARKFPNENISDWMRVATWYEQKRQRGGALGLETRIAEAVETGKKASPMVNTIAGWPCRNFYTTNFDTHLEGTLLAKGRREIYIWIYTPKATDLRQCWWVMKPDEPLAKWEPAWEKAPPSGVPLEPPNDATVVFKLHGDVRLPASMVITEDDYIKFFRRITRQTLPSRLLVALAKTLIFVGYSLRDFNMRYILSVLREDRDANWATQEISYSVDLRPDPLLRATWQDRDNFINFIAHNLWDVIPAVQQRLEQAQEN